MYLRQKSPPNGAMSPICLHCEVTHLSLTTGDVALHTPSWRVGVREEHCKACKTLWPVSYRKSKSFIWNHQSQKTYLRLFFFLKYRLQVLSIVTMNYIDTGAKTATGMCSPLWCAWWLDIGSGNFTPPAIRANHYSFDIRYSIDHGNNKCRKKKQTLNSQDIHILTWRLKPECIISFWKKIYNWIPVYQLFCNTATDIKQILFALAGIASTIRTLCQHCFMRLNVGCLGAVSIRKTVLPGMAIPMLKIRRPNGRLIFNMEIAIRR